MAVIVVNKKRVQNFVVKPFMAHWAKSAGMMTATQETAARRRKKDFIRGLLCSQYSFIMENLSQTQHENNVNRWCSIAYAFTVQQSEFYP